MFSPDHRIVFCPLHQAAGQMQKAIRTVLEAELTCLDVDLGTLLDHALATSEGKERREDETPR